MNNRNMKLMFLDAAASIASLYLAFLIRFDFSIPENFFKLFLNWAPLFMALQLVVFIFEACMRVYGATLVYLIFMR